MKRLFPGSLPLSAMASDPPGAPAQVGNLVPAAAFFLSPHL